MLHKFLRSTLFAMGIALATGATAFANIVIDLDPKAGDQGMRSAQIKAGETKTLELVAEKGALGIAGFEVIVTFDTQQFTFKGYQTGGLMANAVTLPAQQSPNGVKISVGILGGKSNSDQGSLGTFQLEATQNLSSGGKITLIEGSFGAQGKTETFKLNSEAFLISASAKNSVIQTSPSQGTNPAQTGTQTPSQGQGGPPPGPPGFQNPPHGQAYHGGPGQSGQQTTPKTPHQIFNEIDTNKDGKILPAEFSAWFSNRPLQGTTSPADAGPGGGTFSGSGPAHGTGHLSDADMPAPPLCSPEMRKSEQQPQQTNVPASNGQEGNLIFRTVCADKSGYDKVAIGLPSGREALDFGVEAITTGAVTFGIRVEGGADVYHSSAGRAALTSLTIQDTGPSASGKYEIYIDPAKSAPGARVTVRFIDVPK